MKRSISFSLIALSISLMIGCGQEYLSTEATIIKTEIPDEDNDNFRATIEYFVDSIRYTDVFEVPFKRMLEDSISTPAEGITFDILYNPRDPQKNKIEFNVKAKYVK